MQGEYKSTDSRSKVVLLSQKLGACVDRTMYNGRGKQINQRRWWVLKGLTPKYHHHHHHYHHYEARLNRSNVLTTNGECAGGVSRSCVTSGCRRVCSACSRLASASPEYSTAFLHTAHGHDAVLARARACTACINSSDNRLAL